MLFLLACHYDNDTEPNPEAEAIIAVKVEVAGQLVLLNNAAESIQAAAPDAQGWADGDTADMKAAWKDARTAYEHVEGAIAVLFPDLDVATDERYDGFLADGPDEYLFDDQGVVGVHGIERIVWADAHPEWVVAFESELPGYTAAAFPADETEAGDFRDLLCQKLVDDTHSMREEFEPLALDSPAAFRGVIGSVQEQIEKINLAQSGEDESRYAQYTLADMRANLEGGRTVYAAFQPWLTGLDGGADVDAEVTAGFDRVQAALDGIAGDAIPAVPATWNPDAPSEDDLATEYGQLWSVVSVEADATIDGSLAERMTAAADLLGIPRLPE